LKRQYRNGFSSTVRSFIFLEGILSQQVVLTKYISNIGELIPSDDGTIRTAIDTGCGVRDPSNVCRFISSLLYMHVSTTIKRSRSKPVLTIRLGGVDSSLQVASWGAYLLERNVLTMSFAPRDTRPKCNLLWKEEFLQFSV
jgi:hypothetical protein